MSTILVEDGFLVRKLCFVFLTLLQSPDSSMSESGASTPEEASRYSDYRLRTTAGTSYDVATHQLVPVNAPQTLTFETSSMILSLAVRIRNFTGFPVGSPQ